MAGIETKLTVAQALQRAMASHQAGDLVEAERLYRHVCTVDPRNPHGLHYLGVLAGQVGRNQIAIDLIKRALALDPRYAEAHYNVGHFLAAERRLDEAAAHYRQVLTLKPDFAAAHHSLGGVLVEQGKAVEATACFERALALEPSFAEAHYNLGNVLAKANRRDEAVAHFKRVLTLKPDLAEAHNSLATVLCDQGRPVEATAGFERALALKPDYAEAHYNLGKVLMQQGRFGDAAMRYRRAVALRPDYTDAHHGLGTALLVQGDATQALACFDRALALEPDSPEALNNRGEALQQLKRPAEALAAHDQALALRPDYAEALNCRGNALQDLQRHALAVASYDSALALKPDYPNALYNRGNALRELKRLAEAVASFDGALALRPDFAEALNNRGNALQDWQRHAAAVASYEEALAIRPDYADALSNRGFALLQLKRPAAALASFDQALAIDPGHGHAFGGVAEAALAACDWARAELLAGELELRITQRGSIVSPFTLLGYGVGPALQLECARRYLAYKVPAPAPPLFQGEARRRDKIRIAYLSSDYRRHAVGFLMAGLIELHDRARFEVVGVSYGPDDESSIRARLMRSFDQFHDVRSMSDLDVAKLLVDLQVDIAIDLNGYTQGARPGILAHRPAPIQASYMGFVGTMAADFIDYVIADKTVLPLDERRFYTEKIVDLPDCYWVTDHKLEIAQRTPTRSEAGLPEDGFVFCCFNNNYKITAPVFDVWMRLLGAVEGSVLWLLQDSADSRARLCGEAAARGIDPARLVFAARAEPDAHLARHRLADLFVDTLPYNAHTTASDALWAGLPVLTCRGSTFVGRVATSILQAVGLPELVTSDLEAYEALALRLATDAPLLRGLRDRLAQNRTTWPLFDTDRFRRHMESAYATMWQLCASGESPRSFSVEPEPGWPDA